MKYPVYILLPVAALWFGLSACVPSFDPDELSAPPKLAVYSNFTADQEIQVLVSTTGSVLDPEVPQYVTHAVVQLFQGHELISKLRPVTPADPALPPYYTSLDFRPQEGVTYTIVVEADGFQPVMATSSVPAHIGIDQVAILEFEKQSNEPIGFDTYRYEVEVQFQDPPMIRNYYHLNIYQQVLAMEVVNTDTFFRPSKTLGIVFSPEVNNNSRVASFNGGILLEDLPFSGAKAVISLPVELRVEKKLESLGKIFVELRSVTEEYFLFHSSVSRQKAQSQDPYTEPILIFNNVENGLGVFAGYNISRDSINIGL